MIDIIRTAGTRDTVDMITKAVAEAAAIIMRIARAIEVTIEVVGSEVEVEGTIAIVINLEKEMGIGAHHLGQGAVVLEVLPVDMVGEDDGV
jgi:hypothetical protein